jgi:hypothetical protein
VFYFIICRSTSDEGYVQSDTTACTLQLAKRPSVVEIQLYLSTYSIATVVAHHPRRPAIDMYGTFGLDLGLGLLST